METRAVDAMTGDDGAGAARRRRERRLHSWMSIACALAEALHHSSGTKPSTCDTRVVEGAQNDAQRQRGGGARVAQRGAAPEAFSTRDAAGSSSGAATAGGHTGIGYELVLHPVVPQMDEQLVEVSLPALAVEYISPAPAVSQASSPVVEFFAPVPAMLHAPTPVVETNCTCASSVPVASARCGVSFTCASFVRSASARWVFLTCASCASCWRSSRLCPRTEFRLSLWT